GRILEHARTLISHFDIRPPEPALAVRALSGGNQQKIVVARELARDFKVLLAAQPTRGVDVGAIEFIHARLREAREQGKAVLLAAVVGDALILSFGQSPGAVYRLLLDGTWGNAYGFGQVLYKATTLVFTGLAVGLGLRAGLFNIGAESQLAAGGFCAALVGL